MWPFKPKEPPPAHPRVEQKECPACGVRFFYYPDGMPEAFCGGCSTYVRELNSLQREARRIAYFKENPPC